MKKRITMGFTAILVLGSLSPTIYAAEVSKSVKVKEENKPFVERVQVESLSLEEAINYGLNSDYSLMELDYTLDSLRITEEQLEDNIDEVESRLESSKSENSKLQEQLNSTTNDTITIDIDKELSDLIGSLEGINGDVSDIEDVPTPPNPSDDLYDTINYLTEFLNSFKTYVGEYTKYQQSQLLKEKIALVQNEIFTFENTLKQLENSLDDVDLNQTSIFNNQVQMRESMEVSITSSFINLIMLQDQLNFLQESLSIQQSQIDAIKNKYELGLISYREYEKETRSLSDLETQISNLEKQLKNEKAAFALTIGIKYDEDYTLEVPTIDKLDLINQELSTDELIHNSFNMINARTELRIAEDNLEEIEDSNESTRDDEKLAKIDVEVAKLKLEALEVSLEKAINNIYLQVQQQYQALLNADKDLQEANIDNSDQQLYYDLGLLSKQDFNSASIAVKQAKFNYNNAKYQYYLITKQIELLEAGVIPTN